MEEDYKLFQLIRRNPINNCVDLSKNMIGKRRGFIYFTENFRIDFENKMANQSRLQEENERLQKENEELKTKYNKDTHTLQNQLDVANADLCECNNIISDYIDTVEEKDKIIDLMAENIFDYEHITYVDNEQFKKCKQKIIKKFEKKVE